jgi:hypothetical protein
MQGAFLTLFPPTPPTNWIIPDIDSVVTRLRQLLAVGFQLTETVMEAAFQLFEHRLDEIGDLLMDSFQNIRKEPKSVIACSCLIQAAKPEREHKKFDLLEFLINRIDQPEVALENVLNHYNVEFKYDSNSLKSSKIRSLPVHSNFYYWILKKYGPNSKITQQCFDDILESRIWIDLKLQENPELDVPEHLTKQAFNSICSIYLEFCNEKVPFKRNYLPYLMMAKDEEIIKPFFEISLPILFGIELQHNLPYDINYEYDRPKVNYNNNNNKRKFNEMVCHSDQNELAKLLDELKDNYNGTEAYKKYLKGFMCRYYEKELNDSDFEQPGSSSESLASKKPRH